MAKSKIKLIQTTPETRKKLSVLISDPGKKKSAKAPPAKAASARGRKVQPEIPDEDRLQNRRRPASSGEEE